MDLIRRYSKRSDLRVDLERVVAQLGRALVEPVVEQVSVRSGGRVNRVWALRDRLSEDEITGIVEGFAAGTSKLKLAKQYGISDSSVKRILRQQRAAGWIVQRTTDASS